MAETPDPNPTTLLQPVPDPDPSPSPTARDLFRNGLAPLTIGVCLVMTISGFEVLGTATAMPAVKDDLGGLSFYGLALAAPLIASIAAIPYGGRAIDRYGPARPLTGALVLFALGVLFAGAATEMWMVAAFRGVQGLGGGTLFVLQLGIVGKAYPGPLKPRMLALLSAMWIMPALIGPGVAGLVADHLSWRWVFWGVLPLLVVAGGLSIPPVKALGGGRGATRHVAGEGAGAGIGSTGDDGAAHDHTPMFSWWGPPVLALGVLAVSSSLRSSDRRLLPLALAGFVAGAVALVKSLPVGTLRARAGIPATVAMSLTAALSYLTVENFVPLALTDVRDRSNSEAGIPLTVAALAWTVGSALVARTPAARRPARASAAALVIAAGIAATGAVVLTDAPYWLVYVTLGVAAFGMGIVFTTGQVVAVEAAPSGQEGTAGGAVQLANELGIAVGVGVSGIFVARFADHLERGFAWAFVMTIIAAVACAVTARRIPTTSGAP
jgi:MFS family permease